MKKIVHLALIVGLSSLFLTTSCQNNPNTNSKEAATEAGIPSINLVLSPAEYKAKLESLSDVQLIDVRTPEEFAEGNIPSSRNIDFYGDDFDQQLQSLQKDRPVMLYCRSGNRSGKTATKLQQMGFREIYDLEGGFGNWHQ